MGANPNSYALAELAAVFGVDAQREDLAIRVDCAGEALRFRLPIADACELAQRLNDELAAYRAAKVSTEHPAPFVVNVIGETSESWPAPRETGFTAVRVVGETIGVISEVGAGDRSRVEVLQPIPLPDKIRADPQWIDEFSDGAEALRQRVEQPGVRGPASATLWSRIRRWLRQWQALPACLGRKLRP